ncbi:endonuclease VII domain-containing protein [Streptomyces qinglanensis]|uniref:endonuclease VII domain-containing protein n=1 Tax=Streptomyces qinglanensis TaxID=943816 RepID=UPI003D71FD1F
MLKYPPVPTGSRLCRSCGEAKSFSGWPRNATASDGLSARCPICLRPAPEHVDHDHETGRVRGVLCFSCNAALGQFRDRPAAMRRAAVYVEGNVWKPKFVAPGVYLLPS